MITAESAQYVKPSFSKLRDRRGSRFVSFSVIYLTVILRGRAGYELIYITNEAVGRIGYYQLISGKSEKNNCFSKFSSNSLDFSCETSSNRDIFFTDDAAKKNFFSEQEIRHQFFLIWSNLTIMAHMMGLGNQSESWKIIIMS